MILSEVKLVKMQTIFWATMVFLSGLAETITLYFHFSHDDLKKGTISTLEITEAVRNYYPIEIFLQIFISIMLLIYKDYLAFILSFPMLVYSLKMLIKEEYKCHAFFLEEYKERKNIEQISKYKCIFHCALLAYVGIRFLRAFSKFMAYRLFGS